jgi:predicted O-methyltransferase YrrM
MERWTQVDDYLNGLFALTDDALAAALRDTAAQGLPTIQVTPALGQLLAVLVGAVGARRVLEIGTLGGYSAIWMARALPVDGRLVTLEIDGHHADVARRNLARAGVAERVEVVVAPARETLDRFIAGGEQPFDFVFIDADKDGYPDYLERVLALVHPGTLIVADNVVRGGTVIDAGNDDPRVAGVRRFNEMLARDRRLRATIVQTVGDKGYDGIAVALVQHT